MNRNLPFKLRRLIIYGFYVGCFAAVVGPPVVIVGWILFLPRLAGIGGDELEFVELSGAEVQRLHGWCLPDAVDPSDVKSVSCRTNSSRDSHSTWTRVVTSPKSAEMWRYDVHRRQKLGAFEHPPDELIEGSECVDRSIPGPPSTNQKTGEEPAWWSPPLMSFESTEVMIWYKHYDSGVARGTYTAYDTRSLTLWIYSFQAQHHRFWQPGDLPEGVAFSNLVP